MDRGTELCGRPDTHACRLSLSIDDIDHMKSEAKNPQTNWICERFPSTSPDGREYQISLSRSNNYGSVCGIFPE